MEKSIEKDVQAVTEAVAKVFRLEIFAETFNESPLKTEVKDCRLPTTVSDKQLEPLDSKL